MDGVFWRDRWPKESHESISTVSIQKMKSFEEIKSFNAFLCNRSHHIDHTLPHVAPALFLLTLLRLIFLQHLLHNLLLLDQKRPHNPILYAV